MHGSVRGTCPAWRSPLVCERGVAMVAALLVMVLVSGLTSAALLFSQMDVTVAGNYRTQSEAEAAADGGIELMKAMIYGKSPQLNLPLSIPTTLSAARAFATTVSYPNLAGTSPDPDLSLTMTIKYKEADTINYHNNGTVVPAAPAEIVRYGKNYNFQQAPKQIGTQPVFTVTARDARTGTKIEADLISTIGFTTPAALFVNGTTKMFKFWYAPEESIEITAGAGTPAYSTAVGAAALATNFRMETVTGVSSFTGTAEESTYMATNSGTDGVSSTTATICVNTGCSTLPCLHDRVYLPSEVAAAKSLGQYNAARERMHILLGVGERFADLDAVYLSGGAAAADRLFNFDITPRPFTGTGINQKCEYTESGVTKHGVVCYGYTLPAAGTLPTQFEAMMGSSFADLASLADVLITPTGTASPAYHYPGGSTKTNPGHSIYLDGRTDLGTAADPRVVFFTNPGSGQVVSLLTHAGTQASGYGVLVIDGGADIVGSFNWTGLMIVRGDLNFVPWAGGNLNSCSSSSGRSGPELATRWSGFLLVGGNLQLWTYAGGSIFLGYDTSELNNIKVIIANAVPHKVLAWRRLYN